jgi:hypothetical protein
MPSKRARRGLVVSTRALALLSANGKWRRLFEEWLAGAPVFSRRRG